MNPGRERARRGAEAEAGAGGAPSAGRAASPTVEVRIDSIAVGGDGVGREDSGRVVFVPRTAPGDRVVAEVRRSAASYARGFPLRFLELGPERRSPPCPFYAACGGCQLQHLSPAAQLEAKHRAVADALARLGGLDARVARATRAGQEFGYRNRVTFTLRRGAGGLLAGYHHVRGANAVADIEDCLLAEQPVRRGWRSLRAAWGEGARILPAGRELRVTLRASAAGGLALLVVGGEPRAPGDPDAVAAALPGLETYWWRHRKGLRRLAGSERLTETWAGLRFELGPEAFVQVSREAARAIDRCVDSAAGPLPGRKAIDLYAGVGARAIRWALAGATVTAVERDPGAVRAGREAAARVGAGVEFRAEPVEACVAEVLPADVVVANPPRGGLAAGVAEALAARGRGRLVYVSCDPATLARDLRRLGAAWRLLSVRPFDAFPNTAHVETVAVLEAREAAG